MNVEYVDDNGDQQNYKIKSVNSYTKVKDLRAKTAKASDHYESDVVLIFNDQEIQDARTLGYYKIKKDSLIVMETV